MKRRIVEWLFFVICCNTLLLQFSLCTETSFTSSKHEGRQLKNVYNPSKFKGLQGALHLTRMDVENGKKVNIIDENKKGKGSYGGGDLLRPRNKKNGANSSQIKSTSLFSAVLRFGFLGLLPSIFYF
ncbi:hypothetical protein COLO4_18832 [Corchorus olitorius]|uniref:Transmembrane protein n=1 Tax=Corchorus olitorius TaxID=93759 RepID=A0A1R3J7P5_9ROSI|nr:hypothetical protein COLO4_18832 [Corchorus olitorius]